MDEKEIPEWIRRIGLNPDQLEEIKRTRKTTLTHKQAKEAGFIVRDLRPGNMEKYKQFKFRKNKKGWRVEMDE